MTGVEVMDYSTETGLRVRVFVPSSGLTIQMTGEEWHQLTARIKSGELDEVATKPNIPFIY